MAAVDRRETDSGIEIKPRLHARRTRRAIPSRPGSPPFTRGIYPDMYRGRPWTIRQYAGLRLGRGVERPLPLPARSRARPGSRSRSISRPSSGSTPTIRAREGEVGRTGVAIDSLADMRVLFDGIPLDRVSTSMTINAPAALLLLLYELVAEEQGVAPLRSAGTVQNDILKEYIARGNYIFPPRPSMRLTTDLFAYCAERLPRWNTISISGYHIREAGSSAVQELAFTLANGIAYCEAAVAAGLVAGRVRRAPLLLLQRAQRLLPGGREVPGGAAALGAADERSASASRTPRRSRSASTPRPAARR